MRTCGTIGLTLAVAALLYSWKAFTFAVWTNAAMLSHKHPLVAVSAIEGAILILTAVASWWLFDAVAAMLPTLRWAKRI